MVAPPHLGRNQAQRRKPRRPPVGYGDYKPVGSSYASRTMFVSGLVIFTFIIYHLLHFTVQTEGINFTNTDFKTLHDAKQRHDIYNMMVIGFSQPDRLDFLHHQHGAAQPAS